MADQPVTREKLINADKDVQVIEDFIKKPKDETVTTRFGDEIMTLKGLEEEVKKSGGYFKRYTSLVSANADIANIPVNSVVKVTSATDGGDYEKVSAEATSLTKSAYDPVQQAKQNDNLIFKESTVASSNALTSIFDRTQNLFNPTTARIMHSIAVNGIDLIDSTDFAVSDFIAVEVGKKYKRAAIGATGSISASFVYAYDSNKQPVIVNSGNPYWTTTFEATDIPSGVAFIRFVMRNENVPLMMFTESTVDTSMYIPYFYMYKAENAVQNIDLFSQTANKFNQETITIDTQLIGGGTPAPLAG